MSVEAALNILVGMDVKDVQAGARKAKVELKGLGGDAKTIWDSTRTPQERYEQRLQSLAEHVRQGAIDQETFARAVRQASLAMQSQGKGGSGFVASAGALDLYRAKMEELTQALASGSLTQGGFAAQAQAAGVALAESAGGAEAAAHGHKEGERAAKEFESRVRYLEAALHSGQIDFAHYTHGVHEAREAMERAERRAKLMEKALDVAKVALATVGVTYGLEAMAEFLKGSWEAADEARASLGRLEAVVRATGGAAGLSAKEMREYAGELQEATNFSHLQVEQAEAILATHRKLQGLNFKRATASVLDMASVLGTDARSAAVELGRALDDPIAGLGGLSRAGVTFSQNERQVIKDLVEAGQSAMAQGIILDKLRDAMGGTAESMRTEAAAIKNSWDDVKEALGAVLQGKAGKETAGAVASWFTRIAHSLDEASEASDGFRNKLDAWGNVFLDVFRPVEVMMQGVGLIDPDDESFGPRRARVRKDEEEKPETERAEVPQESAEHKKARESLEKLMDSLREETALLGSEGHARELARLKLQGLTAAELAEARSLMEAQAARKREIEQLAEQKKRTDQLTNSVKQLRDSLVSQVTHFGESSDETRIAELQQELRDQRAQVAAAREAQAGRSAAGRSGFDERSKSLDREEERLKQRRAEHERYAEHAGDFGAPGSAVREKAEQNVRAEEAEIAAAERTLAQKRAALAEERRAAQSDNARATYDLTMQERELDLAQERLDDAKRAAAEKKELDAHKKEKEDLDRDLKTVHDETRTPEEQRANELKRLDELEKKALADIDRREQDGQEKFDAAAERKTVRDDIARAKKKVSEEEQPEQKAEHKDNAALLAGTAEAFHAVAKYQNPSSQSIEKQTLKELREIHRALAEQHRDQKKKQGPAVVRKI